MRLVIFDCDGTLVDSQHLIIASMTSAFQRHGLTPPEDKDVRSIIGLSLAHAMRNLNAELSPEQVDDLCSAYRESHFEARTNGQFSEPLFEGILSVIEELNAQEHTLLGIATGKARRGLLGVLERHNLTDHFVTLQTADDAPSKPNPAMIHQALAETGMEQENAVMIGDSSFDILMAKNAGVKSIGVSWGYQPLADLNEIGAEFVAHEIRELPSLIETALTKENL